MDRERLRRTLPGGGSELTRRRALGVLLGGAATLAGGKAADNVLLGYGVLLGTNLREQDLDSLARERLAPSSFATDVSDRRIRFDGETVRVENGDDWRTLSLSATPAEAAKLDADLGLSEGPLEQLVRDLSAIEAGEFRFEFSGYEEFFGRTRTAETRPFTVEALRGDRFSHVEPSTIEAFVGASPENPKAVVEGLVDAFREHTYYDLPRYAAGSVEDNVLFGYADLRTHFRSPTEFDAVEDGETAGMFCYEFTWRSIEALHAAPARRQGPPVFGAKVFDERHKHVYTGIASLIREDGDLVAPMTFVDYTHSTLYDDLHARWLMGEGLEAYDRRHCATDVYWQP